MKYSNDLNKLLSHAVQIANSLSGTKSDSDKWYIYYAETLGQKIINHAFSAYHLSSGYSIRAEKGTGSIVDFSSVSVLVRAALESYLAFHYLFISPKNDEEQSFRIPVGILEVI